MLTARAHSPQSCYTVRVKGPPPHPIPCLRDFPCFIPQIEAPPGRAASRQAGRGREECVRYQETSLLFYTVPQVWWVAPSEKKRDGW